MQASVRATRLAAILAAGCAGTAGLHAAAAQTLALRGVETPKQTQSGLLGGSLFRNDPMAARFGDDSGPKEGDIGSPGDADGIQPTLRRTLDGDAASDDAADDTDQDPFAAANRTGARPSTRAGGADPTADDLDQSAGAAPAATTMPGMNADGSDADATETNSADTAAAPEPKATSAAEAGSAPDAETTGTIPAKSVDEADEERNRREERTNQREQPIEGLRQKPEDDPYAPLGIPAGGFILRPSLETGLTGTTNANSSHGGKGAVLSESTLRLNATSDWSDKTATIDAYGTFRKSIAGQDVSEPSAGINASLAVPFGKDYVARGTFGYSLTPESPSSPGFIAGTVNEPLTQSITGSIGVEKQAGKLRLGLTGNVERDTYGDAKLAGGGSVSQHERDSTLVSATLRAGYEISPALVPFVEGEVGRRYYDVTADSAGFRRSADRLGLRAGVALDLGEKLNGELSAGYLQEKPDDPRLPTIAGPSINTALNWSPVRGTTVALNSSTIVEGTTTAGESGDLLYTSELSIQRQMRANLTGTASIGGLFRDYFGSSGHDFGWNAELGMTYWLNRYFGITGRLRHEELTSNLPDRDYKSESVFLGVKVQR
ncbi:MAG: outer membrane beta-barrel protein [Rhizobiaceae bacterium]